MSKKKRYYLVVTPFFPSEDNWRGPFIFDQVRALKRVSDYEIIVFKPYKIGSGGKHYNYKDINVYQFPVFESPGYLYNGIFNGFNSRQFVKCVKSLNIDISQIDFVHCHTSVFGAYGLALKRINEKIKVMLQHHDLDPYTIMNGRFLNWRSNIRFRAKTSCKIFDKVDIHIVISKACCDNLVSFPQARTEEQYEPYLRAIANVRGMKKPIFNRIITLYNGIDIGKFYPERAGARHNGFIIGCVGNFIPLKRQSILIKAVNHWLKKTNIRNVKIILIGSGPELTDCKRICSELGLDNVVEFRDEISHEELRDFYNSIDLFVLPSVFEGFGCVCLESYACGTPYMICRNQGAADYIMEQDLDLWTFGCDDYVALSQCIENYYNNRHKQLLMYPVDIDILMRRFLDQINHS